MMSIHTLAIHFNASLTLFILLKLVVCTDVEAKFTIRPRSPFTPFRKERDLMIRVVKNISEASEVGYVVLQLKAVDNKPLNHDVQYRIDRRTDPKRQFGIDTNGTLKVAAPLDRENIPRYELRIEAKESDVNVDDLYVELSLNDVNDNPPVLYTISPGSSEPGPCIFMENTKPEEIAPCIIQGVDRDSEDNGPPFIMYVAESHKLFPYSKMVNISFNQTLDDGNGAMIVKANKILDREDIKGKIIAIPITVSDGEKEAVQIVNIIIGDKNDNEMKSANMAIEVYKYENSFEEQYIGMVYVEDEDDWDISDKTFEIENENENFEVKKTGQIIMRDYVMPGKYQFTVNVTDKKRNENARSDVNVTVHLLSRLAFDHHAVLRISGASENYHGKPEHLLGPPRDQFVLKLKEKLESLGKEKIDIDIFSFQQSEFEGTYDLRFTVKADGVFLSHTMTEGIIAAHWDDFKKALEADIYTTGIDLCKYTQCDHGCQTRHYVNKGGVVVSRNSTVFVGINTTSEDVCECPIPSPLEGCSYDYCYNEGVCYKDYHPGALCHCQTGDPGERCEGFTRSFTGTGFLWLKTLPACTSLNISLSFRTKKDGVILYNGPFNEPPLDDSHDRPIYEDFIYVAIENNVVVVKQLNGQKEVEVKLDNDVADGKIHHLQLLQTNKILKVILDNCESFENGCYKDVESDDDERLNLITPLQLGGFYKIDEEARTPEEKVYSLLQNKSGFNGCIMDLRVNGEKYDLSSPQIQQDSSRSCDCESIGCLNGQCYPVNDNVNACKCKVGYEGKRCENRSPWVQFTNPQAFAIFHTKSSSERNDVKTLMVINVDGKVASLRDGNEVSASVYLSNAAMVDLGNSLTLKDQLNLSRSTSYLLEYHRQRHFASLSIDGKSHSSLTSIANLTVPQINSLMVGQESNGFAGCLRNLHYNDEYLKIRDGKEVENIINAKWNISYNQQNVVYGCDIFPKCESSPGLCPEGLVCFDHWKGPICVCTEEDAIVKNDDGTLLLCRNVGKLTITTTAIAFIVLCLVFVLSLLFLVFCDFFASPIRVQDKQMLEEFPLDILKNDSVECGESDNTKYNLDNLKKPRQLDGVGGPRLPNNSYADELDRDPNSGPYDELRFYALEGDNQSTLTFESLSSVRQRGNHDQRRY